MGLFQGEKCQKTLQILGARPGHCQCLVDTKQYSFCDMSRYYATLTYPYLSKKNVSTET